MNRHIILSYITLTVIDHQDAGTIHFHLDHKSLELSEDSSHDCTHAEPHGKYIVPKACEGALHEERSDKPRNRYIDQCLTILHPEPVPVRSCEGNHPTRHHHVGNLFLQYVVVSRKP